MGKRPTGMPETVLVLPETEIPDIGPLVVTTARGPVVAHDIPGMTTLFVERVDGLGTPTIAVVLYAPGEGGAQGVGFIHQMDADSADAMGDSLKRLATLVRARGLN